MTETSQAPQGDGPVRRSAGPSFDRVVPNAASFLRSATARNPSGVAVQHREGSLTYSELLQRSTALAQALPRLAADPEPILVLTEHDATTPEIYFAILMSGNAIVPVSARLPDEAVHQVAEAAGARLGIVTPDHADRLESLNEGAASVAWQGYVANRIAGTLPDEVEPLPRGTAMISFTSGTTGAPKGVVVTHTNLLANGLTSAMAFGMAHANCQINALPLSHFAGASRVILATVQAGTHVVLPEFDPDAVLAAIEAHRGTHLTLAPSMAGSFLAAEPECFDLRSLQTLVYGTAAMPLSVVTELRDRLDCDLINGYGLTESTGLVTALDAAGHRLATETGDEELLSSVGFPVPGVEVRVVDEHVSDVEPGVSGEVMVRGLKVTQGYLRDPDRTRERYLPDGWLRTGDRGRLAGSRYLVLEGRVDEMIITGGVNVHPAEIEEQALEFPGVQACAAFPVPSSQWGEEVRLAVLVEPGPGFDAASLVEFLRGRLDRYKVPKAIHVIDELPKSSLGKVKRSELTDRFMQSNNQASAALES